MSYQTTLAALNTLKVSRLTLIFVKLFGTKSEVYENELVITLHHWRGSYYLTDLNVNLSEQLKNKFDNGK